MRSTAARRTTPTPRRRVRRALVIGVAVLAVAGIAAGITAAAAARTPVAIGSVDGVGITRDELVFHMQRVQPAVANDLRLRTGADVTDWSAPVDGRPAVAFVRDAALAEIEADRALLGLAAENGLDPFADFAGFEAAVVAENESRRAAAERGDVVYGQTSFTPEEFYGRSMSDLRERLVSALAEGDDPILRASDAEVAAYLDANRADWGANVSTYALTRVAVPADGFTDAAFVSAVSDAGSAETFTAATPGASSSPATFDGATGLFDGRTDPTNPALVEQLPTLAIGDLSAPVVERGELVTYRVDSVDVDEDAALAQYGSRIRSLLLDAALDAHLSARIDSQQVRIDEDALDRITLEDLNR